MTHRNPRNKPPACRNVTREAAVTPTALEAAPAWVNLPRPAGGPARQARPAGWMGWMGRRAGVAAGSWRVADGVRGAGPRRQGAWWAGGGRRTGWRESSRQPVRGLLTG